VITNNQSSTFKLYSLCLLSVFVPGIIIK